MAHTSAAENRHLIRIDVLRGFAIFLVLAYHSSGAALNSIHIEHGKPHAGSTFHPDWHLLPIYPLRLGNTGVSLFFVTSGYVIHRSYMRDRKFAWSDYASRRLWRIYPAYFMALLGFATWSGDLDTSDFALHMLMLHNFSADTYFGINPSFWSLAVEVQLYLMYPLAIFVRRRWGAGEMLCVGILASAVWRILAAIYIDWPGPNTYHIWSNPIALWPDWLLGAYLAEQHASGRRVFSRPRLWAWSGAALYVLGEFAAPLRTVQFSFASVVAAVLLEVYLHSEASPGRFARYLSLVGICSYSLYLIHQPFMVNYAFLLSGLGMQHPTVQVVFGFPIYTVVSILIAWIMYSTVGRGGARLGKWLSAATRPHAPLKVQAAIHG